MPDCREIREGISSPVSAQEIIMGNLASLKTAKTLETDEWQLRVDLAAAFRLAARYDWHEAVANHFSLAVSPEPDHDARAFSRCRSIASVNEA